jgi:VIT1/CCC1 family predicted Fe2+/Mn2+ transporter
VFQRHLVRQHISEERRRVDLLSEIREVIFGMQDGLLTSVGVVSAVGSAVDNNWFVLVAGFATAFAGTISMAAGEYISSKSQREVYEAEIEREREEVRDRPDEAHQEIKELFEREGLTPDDAHVVAHKLATSEEAWLRTMVEKELGLLVDEHGSAARGALFMGVSYLFGALVPILPYVLLAQDTALFISLGLTGLVLFGIGVGKALIAQRNPLTSGLEVTAIGALSGGAGYLLGTVIPSLLGAPPVQ